MVLKAPSVRTKLLEAGRRMLTPWVRFWRWVEGPELEAPIWHSHYHSARVLRAGLRTVCGKLEGRVWDIGAGTGLGGRFLDPRRTHYIPSDLRSGRDPSDLQITREGERTKVICSGYALPVREGCLDAVMAHSVLEHVREPGAILAETNRALRPGGNLVVSTPFCFPVHGAPDDFWRWTAEGLKVEIERAGFVVDEVVLMGSGFEALALNLNLLLRYHLPQGGRSLQAAIAIARPFLLLTQLLTNILALCLASFDRSGALPLAVAIVGRKRTGKNP